MRRLQWYRTDAGTKVPTYEMEVHPLDEVLFTKFASVVKMGFATYRRKFVNGNAEIALVRHPGTDWVFYQVGNAPLALPADGLLSYEEVA